MFCFFFSAEIRSLEAQNADHVAVMEDCIDFSLAKTVSEIEEKLDKGCLPDCLDDDIIPNVGNEIGAGRFLHMVSYFILTSWLLVMVSLGGGVGK